MEPGGSMPHKQNNKQNNDNNYNKNYKYFKFICNLSFCIMNRFKQWFMWGVYHI